MVLSAILTPGAEVIILSPQWLFALGLVRAAHAMPVEVPVFVELSKDASFDFIAAVKAAVTDKTRAIYFNTPNNPTGYSMPPAQLAQLAAFAEEHDLWLLSDNAYENYDFSDHGFREISTIGHAQARTFSIHSFSKSYIMPGFRIGYVVCPPGAADRLRKFGLYSIYSVATASQYGAYQALCEDPAALERRHRDVRRARDITRNIPTVPHSEPMGGFYTFLDLSAWEGGTITDFVDRCLAEGITVAPGEAFGSHFSDYARLCFTAVSEDALPEALRCINRIYARGMRLAG